MTNTLSLWEIDSIEKLDVAVLAIVSSSKGTKIETVCVVCIPEENLIQKSFSIKNTQGDTAVDDLVGIHRNLCDVTYSSLGALSALIVDEVVSGNEKRYTGTDLKKILTNAYVEKRISENKCTEKLLSEIKKATENMNTV